MLRALLIAFVGLGIVASSASASGRNTYVPAPAQFSVVYDSPKDAGGINPKTGQPFPAVGQYADINTNTVHTTPGFSKRQVAQDVGQLVGYNVLTPGDRAFFSKMLGVDPAKWENKEGADVTGQTGDEAFANYYAIAATGGLQKGESLAMGMTSIRPDRLRKFTAAIGRLGKRYKLPAYKP